MFLRRLLAEGAVRRRESVTSAWLLIPLPMTACQSDKDGMRIDSLVLANDADAWVGLRAADIEL